jgi:hypothetical protein
MRFGGDVNVTALRERVLGMVSTRTEGRLSWTTPFTGEHTYLRPRHQQTD